MYRYMICVLLNHMLCGKKNCIKIWISMMSECERQNALTLICLVLFWLYKLNFYEWIIKFMMTANYIADHANYSTRKYVYNTQ